MTLHSTLRAAARLVGVAAAMGAALAQPARATPDCAGPASDTWINVTVDNVRNANGLKLAIGKSFLRKRP